MRILAHLALVPLAACTTISSAPEDSPRVEAEVVYLVDASVRDTLVFDAPLEPVEARFESIVEPVSDLGMRLYAVPAESYQPGHLRADFVLTIELTSLTAMLLEETFEVGEEGEQQVTTSVESLECTVTARFERRRVEAPVLKVGSGSGSSELKLERTFSTQRPEVEMIPLRFQPGTGEFLEVRADDFDEVVEKAVLRALKQLEVPIDRELSLSRSPGLG